MAKRKRPATTSSSQPPWIWLVAGLIIIAVALFTVFNITGNGATDPESISQDTSTTTTTTTTTTAATTVSVVATPSPTAEPATPVPPTLNPDTDPEPTSIPIPSPSTTTVSEQIPVFSYNVVNSYPHDAGAFTQGLVYQDEIFYEGTGLHGQSSLRKVDPETGQVLEILDLAGEYFGEGIAIFDDKIYQLTWQSRVGFVYDKNSFELLQEFSYPTEGWGLTHDGQRLIMSDGTDTLYFLDPITLERVGQVAVQAQGQPVVRLNELEYINGEVYANIWQTDRIARIDPATGEVTAWIDLSGLLPPEDRTQPVDVLNGIAYQPDTDRLFVTGKLWPKLFEIELVPAGQEN
ncbi:MAG: glutaminyl-peptide cyclotransferase [Anaerolineae bacterium]|nr:glutaminyl-peptide cyclotransferase [Anaerolineae bacterium]